MVAGRCIYELRFGPNNGLTHLIVILRQQPEVQEIICPQSSKYAYFVIEFVINLWNDFITLRQVLPQPLIIHSSVK